MALRIVEHTGTQTATYRTRSAVGERTVVAPLSSESSPIVSTPEERDRCPSCLDSPLVSVRAALVGRILMKLKLSTRIHCLFFFSMSCSNSASRGAAMILEGAAA